MRIMKRNRGGTSALSKFNPPMAFTSKNATFNTPKMRIEQPYPQPVGSSQQTVAAFNHENSVYTQSYRTILNQGTTPFTPVLASGGEFFYGLALTTNLFSGLSDTSVNFAINGRNILVNASALLFIPNYSQGMLYYPIPQPLTGKDTFKIEFVKQDAGAVTMYYTFVYKPII